MVKFLSKLGFVFFTCFLLTIVLHHTSSYILKLKSDFYLKETPKYIILGHSHSECAFNDRLIPNTTNLSESGESYFYTYAKCKELFKQNESIKYAFIEFSNNQILKNKDLWIYDDVQLSYRFTKFSAFISTNDQGLLFVKNPVGYINALSLSIKYNAERLYIKNYRFTDDLGGYNLLDSEISKNNDNDLIEIESKNKDLIIVSSLNLEYLDKLINLCLVNNITPILIKSPLHPNYPIKDTQAMYQQIRKERFNEIKFLDYSKFPLEDEDFADIGHLNNKGATKLSQYFANQLKVYNYE